MGFGITKLLLLLVLLFVLFGTGRFSAFMRDIAQGVRAFRREMAEDEKPETPKSLAAPKALSDQTHQSRSEAS